MGAEAGGGGGGGNETPESALGAGATSAGAASGLTAARTEAGDVDCPLRSSSFPADSPSAPTRILKLIFGELLFSFDIDITFSWSQFFINDDG